MEGNQHIRQIIQAYTTTIINTGESPVPFMVLMGPSGLGKMNVAMNMGKQIIGEYWHQDMLVLRDCSKDIEKDHTIKVSNDEEIECKDGTIYIDLGIREINERMVKSPAGKRKILIIENAERMNDQSANALLKMLEEPLPGRLIIATCSRPHQLLSTILSRALLFSFYPTEDSVVQKYIADHANMQQYNIQRLTAIASGRPGILDELSHDPTSFDLLQKAFDNMQDTKMSITEQYSSLVAVSKAGYEKLFLQAYIYRLSMQHNRQKIKITQDAFALTDYNINNDHILFDFVLAHHAASHT